MRIYQDLHYEQNRQCASNITLGLVRATIVAAEEQRALRMMNVCL